MRGAFGKPGVSFLLSRRAHLLTTHEVGGGIAFGNRALCEADAAPAGALCPMPHHICAAVIGHAVGCLFRFTAKQGAEQNRSAPTPPARIKLPPAALFAVMGIAPRNTHFLFCEKETKNQERKDGETEWQSTIWKLRWSAVGRDALPWQLPLI